MGNSVLGVKVDSGVALLHISLYLYTYAVKLKTGPIFALFKVKNWSIFFLFFFAFLFLKISFSLQKEEEF